MVPSGRFVKHPQFTYDHTGWGNSRDRCAQLTPSSLGIGGVPPLPMQHASSPDTSVQVRPIPGLGSLMHRSLTPLIGPVPRYDSFQISTAPLSPMHPAFPIASQPHSRLSYMCTTTTSSLLWLWGPLRFPALHISLVSTSVQARPKPYLGCLMHRSLALLLGSVP
ncbi:hypothetical protein VaNZ11_008687 [Volvox africanus]|uniref:Uncharacterized protein n=1 Tax=Volvox africanus TaxID=51714 RepID=A0ABQ5S5M5_9CHLO|nr:hypothetical protein VaNZ11_008687 [Volvox africanus]